MKKRDIIGIFLLLLFIFGGYFWVENKDSYSYSDTSSYSSDTDDDYNYDSSDTDDEDSDYDDSDIDNDIIKSIKKGTSDETLYYDVKIDGNVLKIDNVKGFHMYEYCDCYTLSLLKSIKNSKIDNLIDTIKLSIDDDYYEFNTNDIYNINFSDKNILKYNNDDINEVVTVEDENYFFNNYIVPLAIYHKGN